MNKYPISSYNKYICLKANDLMVLITLYLLKPYIIALASITYRKDKTAIIHLFYPDSIFIFLEMFATIPLLILIYAWTRRVPRASNKIKLTWINGKKLIISTAFFQACILSSPLWFPSSEAMTNTHGLLLILNIIIMIIVFFSKYMDDCFADFPEDSKK
ncbi:MAG: DUF2919 family protein [Methylococcales bacterium]